MTDNLSPGLILIAGALLVPLLRGNVRNAYMLALPVVAFAHLLGLPYGQFGQFDTLGLTLTTLRIDRLSSVFGTIFLIASLLGVIYSLHVRDTLQHVAGLVYAGSAVGAVFAGDVVTLFLFWEGTAISSVFLIWARRDRRSFDAGMRYLLIQVGSGVVLLAGVLLHHRTTGSIAFDHIGLGSLASYLIFVAFGIKCAFPLLHNWLQDAYPEATVTGTVILSAFTTKLAVYALARGYSGTEILVPIGAAMTVFPLFYAAIENDLRRVLAYCLNNQLGFMVVGVGIGTELAIAGTAAHAFSHILYKSLLFMTTGAVLYRAGTIKASELGGLATSMPWTAALSVVGALSISFPLFGGFVSKALIISAAMEGGYFWTWIALLFGSVGVFYNCGLKIPYFAFFAQGSGRRCEEAPVNMLAAMALTAALCLLIGVAPGLLYGILPYEVNYRPYTLEHVVTQLQLLAFATLAFAIMLRSGLLPGMLRSTNLDFDWFYRRAAYDAARCGWRGAEAGWTAFTGGVRRGVQGTIESVHNYHGPGGRMARAWPTGAMAFWTTVLLGAFLILSYF